MENLDWGSLTEFTMSFSKLWNESYLSITNFERVVEDDGENESWATISSQSIGWSWFHNLSYDPEIKNRRWGMVKVVHIVKCGEKPRKKTRTIYVIALYSFDAHLLKSEKFCALGMSETGCFTATETSAGCPNQTHRHLKTSRIQDLSDIAPYKTYERVSTIIPSLIVKLD
jgi:hypothetical protein